MAIYRYLCPMVPGINDPSISEPLVLQELPALNITSIVESAPDIPEGRVLVTIAGLDENDHRAIQAIPEVSWFKP